MNKPLSLVLLSCLAGYLFFSSATLADFANDPQHAVQSLVGRFRHSGGSIRSMGGMSGNSSVSKICSSKTPSLFKKISKVQEGAYIGKGFTKLGKPGRLKGETRLVAANGLILGLIQFTDTKTNEVVMLPVIFSKSDSLGTSEDLTFTQPNRSIIIIKSIKCASSKITSTVRLSKSSSGFNTSFKGFYEGGNAVINIAADGGVLIFEGSIFAPNLFFGKIDSNDQYATLLGSSDIEAKLEANTDGTIDLTIIRDGEEDLTTLSKTEP